MITAVFVMPAIPPPGTVMKLAFNCAAACSLPLRSLRLLPLDPAVPLWDATASLRTLAFFASSSARVRPAVWGLPVAGSMEDPARGTLGDEAKPPPGAPARGEPKAAVELVTPIVSRTLDRKPLPSVDVLPAEEAAVVEDRGAGWASWPALTNPPVEAVAPDGPVVRDAAPGAGFEICGEGMTGFKLARMASAPAFMMVEGGCQVLRMCSIWSLCPCRG